MRAMASMLSDSRRDPDTATAEIECLRCGVRRDVLLRGDGQLQAEACPYCGDVGWARPADLSDDDRRALHSRVAEQARAGAQRGTPLCRLLPTL